MEQSRRSELTRMLDEYARKQQSQNRERDDRRLALERFLSGYAESTAAVIKPCFEEFAAELGERGHPCTVEIDKSLDPADSASAAKITLTVFPNAMTLPHGNPCLSYKASPNQRKITSNRSTITGSGGIVVGVVGEFDLEQLTRSAVEQHLLDLATTIFAAPA